MASVSQSVRQLVFARDAYSCRYCGLEPTSSELHKYRAGAHGLRVCITPLDSADRKFTIDHILPQSRGGSNDISNLATSCFECNNRKGDRIIEPRLIPIEVTITLPSKKRKTEWHIALKKEQEAAKSLSELTKSA